MNADKRYAPALLKLSSLLMIAMGLFALYNAADAFVQAMNARRMERVRSLIVFCLPPLMRAWAMISTGLWGWRRQFSTIFCRSLACALVAPAGISMVVSLYEQFGVRTAIGVHVGTLCNILAVLDIRILKWYRRIEWVRIYHDRWQDYSAYAPDYGYVRALYAMVRNRAPVNKKRSLRQKPPRP